MTRDEELAAIERHVREKGVTVCPPAFANAEAAFITLFRNRQSAGVKREPSDAAAMRRSYVFRSAHDVAARRMIAEAAREGGR